MPVLDFQQQMSVTERETKLYVRASGNCAQANTNSMLRVLENKNTHHGHQVHGFHPRKESASIMAAISAVLLKMDPGKGPCPPFSGGLRGGGLRGGLKGADP